jgi:hypothetical protein
VPFHTALLLTRRMAVSMLAPGVCEPAQGHATSFQRPMCVQEDAGIRAKASVKHDRPKNKEKSKRGRESAKPVPTNGASKKRKGQPQRLR